MKPLYFIEAEGRYQTWVVTERMGSVGHYTGFATINDMTAMYCTCSGTRSGIEAEPFPDCPHALLTQALLKLRIQQAQRNEARY
jgi:hypothetical protein